MEINYKFLIVDDEPAIVLTIERLIKNSFDNVEIFHTHSGDLGLKLVHEKRPDIVITDVRMPGLSGLQMLSELRSKKELQDIYVILMSADTDRQMLLESLDKGADSFIYKPVHSDILIGKIKSAIRVVNIHKERKEEYQVLLQLAEEVEKYASDLIKLAVKFMEARIPASYKNLKIIADASLWISQFFKEIDDRRKKDLEVAAYMSFSGRLSLPDTLINKPILIDGKASDNLMYQVPVAAKNIVSEVKRFERVGTILYHLYENMDGSGFPEKLQSWQIPLESRIIRVAVDFDDIVRFYKFRPSQAFEKLRLEINRSYDHRIVTLLEQYVLSILKLEGMNYERPVLLGELKSGMKLSRDIYTMNGLKILPAGATLSSTTIERILQINTTDPIIGHIFVNS